MIGMNESNIHPIPHPDKIIPPILYGARQMDHDKNLARIDIGNCQFWRVEGITTVIDGVWKQVLDKKRSKVSSKQNVEPK